MLKNLIIALLLCSLSFAQRLAPMNAWGQQVTSQCTKQMDFLLHGTVHRGDTIYLRVNWAIDCPGCGLKGIPLDTFENPFVPDPLYGFGGLLCDARIKLCQLRMISKPSRGTGKDSLRVPLFCPATNVYGMWAEVPSPSPKPF